MKMPPMDKLLHFSGGMNIFFVTMIFSRDLIISIFIAIIAGGLKELYDSYYTKTHTPDIRDFLCTLIGGLTAYTLWILSFHF